MSAPLHLLCLLSIGLQRVGGNVECTSQSLTRCTGPLQVITDNQDLTFAASKDQLEKMCPKLMDGLRCIDSYTRVCLDREQRIYFNSLYTGTTQVIEDLCRPGPYQLSYLRHAPCMREVQEEYHECSNHYQNQMLSLGSHGQESMSRLCCSFQEYLACSQGVVNRTCGAQTAAFTKDFLDRMATPLAQGHCHDYQVGSPLCEVDTDAFLHDGVESHQSKTSSVILILLVAFV